jgi:hypothetical protein
MTDCRFSRNILMHGVKLKQIPRILENSRLNFLVIITDRLSEAFVLLITVERRALSFWDELFWSNEQERV